MGDSFSFLKPYLRGWPIILGAMVLAYMIAAKYLTYVTPMYESSAKMRVADAQEGVHNSNLFKDLDVFSNTHKLAAEIEIMKSRVLLTKAIKKLPFEVELYRVGSFKKYELYDESPFVVQILYFEEKTKDVMLPLVITEKGKITITCPDGNIATGMMGDTLSCLHFRIIIKLNYSYIQSKKDVKVADTYEMLVKSEEKLLSEIDKNLDVITVDKDVPVIRIAYKASHPHKAADFPNALARAYIEDYIENKYHAANVTVNFLNDRIKDINDQLTATENKILAFREQEGITNIRQETETDLRQISQLKIQQTNLKMSLDAIKQLEQYVKSGQDHFLDLAPNFEAFTDLLSTEIIKNIKLLQAEKKDLLLKYTENEEKVRIIDVKIKDLTSYLIESITNTRRNTETKYNQLVDDIEAAEAVFVTVPEKEKMLTIMNREFDIYQQSYNFLNSKKIEAEIARAARIAFHRIITPATVSKSPVSPNVAIIKIVSALLGMMGSIMLIMVVHTLKAKVNEPSNIEKNTMIPLSANIPKLKKDLIPMYFLNLIGQWEVKKLFSSGQIIVCNHFSPDEGADFIVKNLAQAFCFQERKTLLIRFAENVWEVNNHQNPPTQVEDYYWELPVRVKDMYSFTSEQIKQWLTNLAVDYDVVLIRNAPIGDAITLPVMAATDLNFMCLDARLSPMSRVMETQLIQDEYKLANFHFALNRSGYNPSFVKEVLLCIWGNIERIKRMVIVKIYKKFKR
ncbi:G-rich domain on putative tyrosine kinase [Flexibacter flexilis DSM 6793]|uniref:G-rich domain on putative tyrosine kinase n=1 Tax=Flexibacter flexilis DSM 6793 TaxID=927664 RepID=A0A1I1L7D9_9BACT|nr:Wzz/FepE/Etk N-terminal domain-containing protein [Flexibacter flexilis]SFC66948.1 G-rich domain on putative tyrosine kinase [Flexibacter flexilis DSM 6793]